MLEDRVLPSVGNLDLGFGNAGKVLTTVGTANSQANAIIVQNDNRIVAAGVASNGHDNDFALLRYNPDGSLDTTFGVRGQVLTDFGHGDDEALALALQANGKIVAAGSATDGSHRDIALARYNKDGSLDPTFGIAGKVTFAFASTSTEVATALALQTTNDPTADDNIVVAGQAGTAHQDMAVARFNANGTPDSSFGSGGGTLIDFGVGDAVAAALGLQADGKIVVAGKAVQQHSSGTNRDFALARLTASGALDNSFGTAGKVTTDFGFGDDAASSLAIQGTGDIVLAGQMTDGKFNFIALARYTPAGVLDASFGTGGTTLGPQGTITTSVGASDDAANALVIQPNGRLVVAGRTLIDVSGIPTQNLALARYTADGAVDQTFGINGQVTTAVGSGAAVANGVAATADGKLVVAGSASSTNGTSFALVRYQADIRPIASDDQFSAASGSTQFISLPVLRNDFDPDGDPLQLAGLKSEGIVIPPSTQTTVTVTPKGNKFTFNGSVILFQPKGGAAGTYGFTYTISDGWLTSAPATVTVTVVNSTIQKAGDLVPQFGQTGRQLFLNSLGGENASSALAFQADGKVLAAGSYFDGTNTEFEVIRLNADGSQDFNYGFSGFADVPFGFGDNVAYAVAVQSDGAAVVAGYATNSNGNRDFGLLRFDTSGMQDTTFGNGGLVFTDFAGGKAEIHGMALQPDGKIVVAGFAMLGTNQDIALARYNPDGSLDITFGTGGSETFSLGVGADTANAVLLQPDGKIVVAGSVVNGHDEDFALIRLFSDGRLDPTFGQNGLATLDFGRGDDVATALAVQPDGNFVLAGYAFNGHDRDFALARFTATGQVDTTFGGDGHTFGPAGTVTTNLGPRDDEAKTVSVLDTGKIMVGGFSEQNNYSTDGINKDFALVRYDVHGRVDKNFGTNGSVISDQAADEDVINALIVQPDDRIVVTGNVNAAGHIDKIVERFNTDGSLDTTYVPGGSSGRVFASFGRANDYANAVAVQSDGKIVAAGSAGNNAYFGLIRREGDRGIRDDTFGADGRVLTKVGPGQDIAKAVAIQPDGKIVAVGSSEQDNGSPLGRNQDFALVRYNPDGSLDTTFGHGGIVTTDFNGWNDSAQAVVLLANGNILVAGSSALSNAPGQLDFALAEYNPDGSLDVSFGQGGKVITGFGHGDAVATGLAVLPDGSIVVGGYASNGSNSDFALARYTVSGRLDTTFGNVGRVTTDFDGGDDQAHGLAVQADGKIVLAGSATTGATTVFALARYNSNGTLDTSFQDPNVGRTGTATPAGTVTTSFNGDTDVGNGVVIQADGKIVVVGTSKNQTSHDFAVARYLTNGLLDTTFGNGGKTTFSVEDDNGTAVALAPDGQIVVAGSTNSSNFNKSGFVVARLFDRPLNDFPPVTVPALGSTTEGVPVVIPVLLSASDQNKIPLSVIRITQGGAGSVQLNADGTVTYTPEPDFSGTDHFTYTVSDGQLSTEGTVTVHVIANPPRLGAVIDGGQHLVVGESWLDLSSPTAVGQLGSFAVLTNGDLSTATDTSNAGVDNHVRLRGAFDVSILDLTLNIPADANYLSFDFAFDSNEYPFFRNRGFNDAFLAELDRTTWSVDPVTNAITAPDNFAFDAQDSQHRPVSAASHFFDDRRVETLTGNFYNGGTPLLEAGTPITPGLHHLYLSILDVGDGQIDSAVFLRNLVVRRLPVGSAAPGVHQPPLAVDDFVPFRPNQPITLHVLDNDISFDGTPFALVRVSPAGHGQVLLDTVDDTVTYTPTSASSDGSDTFTYTIQDAEGNTSTATVHLVPLLAASASQSAAPTDPSVTVATTGIVATLSNDTLGSAPTPVTVGNYSANPGLATSAGTVSLKGASFFEVKVLGSHTSDQVLVSFAAPADGSQLLYWTWTAFEPVRGSGDTPPTRTADGRFQVLLDGTSHPRITGLTGTVFTVSIPVNTPSNPVVITPPVVLGSSGGTPGGTSDAPGQGQTATFRSSAELSLALVPFQNGQGSGTQNSQAGGANGVLPGTGTNAAIASGSSAGSQSSGGGDNTDQVSNTAALWRTLLGDEVYWLWLMGGDEVLMMWLQKGATGVVPAAAPPNPPADRPMTPTPEGQSRRHTVETLFADALPEEYRPTFTDAVAPCEEGAWIPVDMAVEARTQLANEPDVYPENAASVALALSAVALAQAHGMDQRARTRSSTCQLDAHAP